MAANMKTDKKAAALAALVGCVLAGHEPQTLNILAARKPTRNTESGRGPVHLDVAATATVTMEAAGADGEAKLPAFTMIANNGNPMMLQGWRYPVVLDFTGLNIPAQNRPIRFNHDSEQGVGHTTDIKVDAGKLIARGVISRDTPAAREVVSSSKNGFPWQASVGANADEVEFIKSGESVVVNGKTFEGPLNVARAATLGEISFVDLGADDQTSASVAAAKKSAATGGDDDGDEDGDNGNDERALTSRAIANAKAERSRLRAIRALVEEALTDPGADETAIEAEAADAIDNKLTAKDFQIKLLRMQRPKGGFAIRAREQKLDGRTLEAALCLTGGCTERNVEKWYGADTITAARENHPGVSLSELFHHVIAAAGKYARAGRLTNDTIRTAFEADRILRAESNFSTVSLSGVLSNVANKTMLQAYQAVPMVGPLICGESDANDFKQMSRYRMTGSGVFEKIGPDGELKHTTLTEEVYHNQVETFGRIITLTRQMLLNDDLGAFLQIPRIMGRQSALAVEDAVFTLLLSNPSSFFAAGNNNYISGAATNLQISSLTTAEQKFLDQVDSDGKPVLITPRYLLVPSSLKVTAQQLMTETRVVASGTTDKIVPANNPHAGKWEPLASPYLNNASYTGNSTTAWYLVADPADVAFMEIAYLRGQRTPVIESGESDFDTLGMKWRGYFDFGVAMQDKRGAVMSKGAA